MFFLIFATGCASFQAASQVQSGRRALLANQPETALDFFQQAAESDPNYIYSSVRFHEGVWTYVGRAQYALGNWPEAQSAFERALTVYKDDPMAQLYLGLAMIKSGDQRQGFTQLKQGIKSLSDWIDYLNYSKPS
ncbi:MAG: tetratricopeptide repeat protein, partial [Deltaproteobacteria bacterium]|nr:tetratricopeptide repeat protein [Deltaproteobacteria bacterium]